jgi:hypothetical protein
VIRLADCGLLTQGMSTKFLRVTKMKYSLALSTMRETLSSLGQRIILAAFGRINMHLRG